MSRRDYAGRRRPAHLAPLLLKGSTMPEFQMNGKELPAFASLSPFAQGYIEALFFTESCASLYTIENWQEDETQEALREGQADGCLPSDSGFSDLHPDALEAIKRDCGAFHVNARDLLRQAYKREGYSEEQAGHDFWLTRNGHGTGFWDRAPLAFAGLGERLSEKAREFGESHVWFADHVDYGNAPFVHYQ